MPRGTGESKFAAKHQNASQGPLGRGRFDENGGNDEFAFYPVKTRVWLLRPPKTTKMTKNGGCHSGKGMV